MLDHLKTQCLVLEEREIVQGNESRNCSASSSETFKGRISVTMQEIHLNNRIRDSASALALSRISTGVAVPLIQIYITISLIACYQTIPPSEYEGPSPLILQDNSMFFTERVTAQSTGDETTPQICTILIMFRRNAVEKEARSKLCNSAHTI